MNLFLSVIVFLLEANPAVSGSPSSLSDQEFADARSEPGHSSGLVLIRKWYRMFYMKANLCMLIDVTGSTSPLLPRPQTVIELAQHKPRQEATVIFYF